MGIESSFYFSMIVAYLAYVSLLSLCVGGPFFEKPYVHNWNIVLLNDEHINERFYT